MNHTVSMLHERRARLAFFLAPPDDSGGGDGETVIVGQTDSILSIAKSHGFFWKTIWNHGKNAQLKQKRKDPEILQAGDEVFVPKPEPKKVTKGNESRHKFKLKGEQAKFKIQLKQMGEPRKDEDYILVVNGTIITGKTDGDGKIECDIPNDANSAELKLQGGKESYTYSIGHLDPADSPSGVRQRLENLGYVVESGDNDKMPTDALKEFQEKNGLQTTGELDGPTKAKLSELHNS